MVVIFRNYDEPDSPKDMKKPGVRGGSELSGNSDNYFLLLVELLYLMGHADFTNEIEMFGWLVVWPSQHETSKQPKKWMTMQWQFIYGNFYCDFKSKRGKHNLRIFFI